MTADASALRATITQIARWRRIPGVLAAADR
jgi:hypothetical protein